MKNAETITNSDGTTSFLPSNMIFLAALAVLAALGVCYALYRVSLKRRAE